MPPHRRMLVALCLLMCASLAAAQQKTTPLPAPFVARPVVNMYSAPSEESDVISQALYGAAVASLESKDGWRKIRTADQYEGWVRDEAIAEAVNYAPEGHAVKVSQLSANIYREPDVTRHAPLLNLPWESRLEVLPETVGTGERWLKVKLVDGHQGFVQKGDVSSDFTPLSIDQMIALAHRFLGVTYTWGGVSSFGFDCSGFTQMLERQRGILMPRDADVQAAWSGVTAVTREQLAPGDLLFFGEKLSHITHTGMYIGGGQFIHDTVHGHPSVQISRLDDMPWTKLLVAARRVK